MTKHTQFKGLDDNGEPIIDPLAILPTLTFHGRVKLHGTNAGVTLDVETGIVSPQSRAREISLESDNAGFAQFVETIAKDTFYGMLNTLALKHIDAEKITIFGEWSGGNIQRGVGINGLDKFFAAFEYAVKVMGDDVIKHYLLPSEYKSEDKRIFHIDDFGKYKVDINFGKPNNCINEIALLTTDVEKDCPAAKYLNSKSDCTVGEGIVWSHSIADGDILRFKVKGEKHSSSKVKKLATVDPEKLKSIDSFIEYAVTTNRLDQGFDEVFTQTGTDPIIQNIGLFIRWVSKDVIKEERDTLTANDLEMRDVGSRISNEARCWFIKNHC